MTSIFFIIVYMFDPRSAIPLAVQTNVLRNSSFLAATFQPNMKGLKIKNKKDIVTTAKLFYMNNRQVKKEVHYHCQLHSI